jgi:hypothetical protein
MTLQALANAVALPERFVAVAVLNCMLKPSVVSGEERPGARDMRAIFSGFRLEITSNSQRPEDHFAQLASGNAKHFSDFETVFRASSKTTQSTWDGLCRSQVDIR